MDTERSNRNKHVHGAAIGYPSRMGVDISVQRSNPLSEFTGREILGDCLRLCPGPRPVFSWSKQTLHKDSLSLPELKGQKRRYMHGCIHKKN